MAKKAWRYASATFSAGAPAAASRATASSRLRPITCRIAASSGAAQPWTEKASRMQATIACWLSTRVPSQSKTTRRGGPSGAEIGIALRIHRKAEEGEALLHVPGQGRLHLEHATLGMRHADRARMQMQQRLLRTAGQRRLAPAILEIAQDGRAERGAMDAELMRAPRLGQKRQPGRLPASAVDQAPMSDGPEPVLLVRRDALAARARELGERQIDGSDIALGHADRHRPIELHR